MPPWVAVLYSLPLTPHAMHWGWLWDSQSHVGLSHFVTSGPHHFLGPLPPCPSCTSHPLRMFSGSSPMICMLACKCVAMQLCTQK